MENKHDIETYSKLAEAARFYLDESFHYVNEAISYEFASILVSEKLNEIDPTEQDQEIVANAIILEDPINLLRDNRCKVLTNETLQAISSAWEKAQIESRTKKHKFEKNHIINSIDILGHLNNFGFFIETLINRHLLYLRHSNKIDDFSYSRISVAKVMERLIFLFKEGLIQNKIQLNEIVNLFSLRNKTVHFTPDNAVVLKPKISELIQIWTQTRKIIEKFERKEKFNEERFSKLLNNHVIEFKNKWT